MGDLCAADLLFSFYFFRLLLMFATRRMSTELRCTSFSEFDVSIIVQRAQLIDNSARRKSIPIVELPNQEKMIR